MSGRKPKARIDAETVDEIEFHIEMRKKRFEEDLVEAMSRMGRPPREQVDLVLEDRQTGEKALKVQVPMTEENRKRVRDGADSVPRKAAVADLAVLRGLLEDRFSYLGLREVDLDAAFAEAAGGLPDRVDRRDLSIRIRVLLAKFGDGHTRVADSLTRDMGIGYLPFLVAESKEGLAAFHESRSGFVDEDRPFLAAIDGTDVEKWIEAAGAIVANGSAQFHRRNSIRNLRYLGWLRKRLGRLPSRSVVVTLGDEKSGNRREVTLPLASRKPVYGDWPRAKTGRLEGDLGYLRIESMDDDPAFLKGLTDAMEKFGKTKGLIIDVRGNGGGTRHALRTVMPHMLSPRESPAVVNLAKYRLPGDEERGALEGYLENRFLYPTTSRRWTVKDQGAILRAVKRLRADWMPDRKRFSDWHAMLIHARKDGRFAPKVVVLMDAGCFSATDIFLAALKPLPNVTLLGTASGGGSGRSRSHTLPASGIRVRISSMASFHPTGGIYDGAGVEPEREVPVRASDLIGRTDSALAAALALLR